jgi:hypothetical protein
MAFAVVLVDHWVPIREGDVVGEFNRSIVTQRIRVTRGRGWGGGEGKESVGEMKNLGSSNEDNGMLAICTRQSLPCFFRHLKFLVRHWGEESEQGGDGGVAFVHARRVKRK